MQDVRERLEAVLRDRIAVLDGSWGVLIQSEVRGEEAYRGERFRDHTHDVAGNPDLLNLTRPEIVSRIHDDYFAAGADIATTNTFTATSYGQADYGLEGVVHELNVEAARLARAVGRRVDRKDTGSTPVRRRRGRSAERDALALAARRRPVVSRRHVRRRVRGVRGADPRAARGRR